MKLYFANRDFNQLGVSRAKKVLVSYWYCQNHVLRESLGKYSVGYEVDLFLDSGAFSAFTQGHEIKIEEYCKWINLNAEHISVYANLDVIGNQVLTREVFCTYEIRGDVRCPKQKSCHITKCGYFDFDTTS